jgi:ADP-ribosylglycohydrolase
MAVIIGHAVADALGVPVEFYSRDELEKTPVRRMMGYGTYGQPRGSWSDDTSMTLCVLDAIKKGAPHETNTMDNFVRWFNDSQFTPADVTFDVGGTCGEAINRYLSGKYPHDGCGLTEGTSCGNGSLMRIHPSVMYAYGEKCSVKEKIEYVERQAALTHAHRKALTGCGIYAFILWELLLRPEKESVAVGLKKAFDFYKGEGSLIAYKRLAPDEKGNVPLFTLDLCEIKSTGYVVDTLEAAIWCLMRTDSYKKCVLRAVNLGDDTDTVGAIAGGLAAALWGPGSIPRGWLKCLLRRDLIEELALGAIERMPAFT